MLLVGGGPSNANAPFSAIDFFGGYIGATNGGLEICNQSNRVPDWMFLSDHVAIERHQETAKAFIESGAMLITTSERLELCLDLGLTTAIHYMPRSKARHPHNPGDFCRPRYSGLMLMEFVLNVIHPRRLWLAGYDGYQNDALTPSIIQPFVQSCIDTHPGCKLCFMAQPLYHLEGAAIWTEPNTIPTSTPCSPT